MAGNDAYVSDVGSGIRVINVSDPAHPWQVSLYHGEPGGLAIADNYLYVAARSGGLRVIDVSDPAHLVQVGSYEDFRWGAYGVAAEAPNAEAAGGGAEGAEPALRGPGDAVDPVGTGGIW